MRTFAIATLAVAATLGLPQLSGCASSEGSRATGQVVDDGAVTARVKAALASEASIGQAMNVDVDTYNGTVQLSGFVDSEQTVQRAQQIAQSVDGVRSVKNDLRVAPKR
jgi:hyperosmotically inducible protein